MKVFIALSLMIGVTHAIFGSPGRSDNKKAHDKTKNEGDLMNIGSSGSSGGGSGTLTGIQVKPIFTGFKIKEKKVDPPPPPKKLTEETEDTDNTKEDMKKVTEIATMSMSEIMNKFPNRQFTFQELPAQSPKECAADKKCNPNAKRGIKKYKFGGFKKPEPVSFAMPGVCKPVDYCEDLTKLSAVHGGYIWPASINYPKCMECCLSHQEPVPVNKVERTVQIFIIPYSNDYSESRLAEHKYEEHQSCKCQCKVKEHHCDKRTQTYDPYNCRCDCRADARDNANCKASQQWSDTHCGCVCKYPDTVCGSGRVWKKETCSCEWQSHGGFGSFGNSG